MLTCDACKASRLHRALNQNKSNVIEMEKKMKLSFEFEVKGIMTGLCLDLLIA